MGQATITVAGYFGKDKEMTRDEFQATWSEHVLQLKRIDYDPSWCHEVEAMHTKVMEKCNEEFDRLFHAQHGVWESDYRGGDYSDDIVEKDAAQAQIDHEQAIARSKK